MPQMGQIGKTEPELHSIKKKPIQHQRQMDEQTCNNCHGIETAAVKKAPGQ